MLGKTPIGVEARRLDLTGGHSALVDPEDFPVVAQFDWYAAICRGKVYAARRKHTVDGSRIVYLHRELMGDPPSMDVDHWNGDTLDCRRRNLRVATRTQNNANQRSRGGASRFKGVYWQKQIRRWCASISNGGRKSHLGTFTDEREAARAYDAAAVQAFGTYALTNAQMGLL